MLVHARRSPNTLVKKLSRTCDRAVRTRAGRTCRMRDLRPSLARSSARGIEPTHSRVCAEARSCVQRAAAPAELHYRPSACEEADAHAVVGTAIHQMKTSSVDGAPRGHHPHLYPNHQAIARPWYPQVHAGPALAVQQAVRPPPVSLAFDLRPPAWLRRARLACLFTHPIVQV